jgi:hypothetical protein
MDAGVVWQIGITAAGVVGTGFFNLWYVGYRVGKVRGADLARMRNLTEAVTRMHRESDRRANQNLRIYQAIEQLRRLHKTGNGGVNWTDLTGG